MIRVLLFWGYAIFSSPHLDLKVQTSERCMSKKWWERKKIFEQGKYFSVQKNILSWKWMHLLRIIFTFQLWCSPWKLIDIDLIKDLQSIKNICKHFKVEPLHVDTWVTLELLTVQISIQITVQLICIHQVLHHLTPTYNSWKELLHTHSKICHCC